MLGHMLDQPRCAVWAGVGVGKTAPGLQTIDYVQLVDAAPALVLATEKVARRRWGDEAAKFSNFSHMEVQPILGTPKERERALRNDHACTFTINYENLPWLVEHLGDRWPFRTVLADEATRLKSFRTRQGGSRAKALGRVAHTKIRRFIELTGTPSPNGLKDLWGQLWFLDGGKRLGRSYTAFSERWFRTGYSGFGLEPLPHAEAEIHDAVRDLCLSINGADWFDLQKPVQYVIEIDLPPKAREVYRAMDRELFADIASNGVEALNAGAKLNKCMQIASGAVYTDDEGGWTEVHDAKISALESLVDEWNGAPVMVGYHFRPDLERLKKAFPGALDLGDDDDLQRAKRGQGRVWLANPASVGHGVDGLQDHCHVLAYFTTDFNFENHDQLIGRIGPMRQFQSKTGKAFHLYYLVAVDTADELALESQRSKRSVQDVLMEATKRRGLI